LQSPPKGNAQVSYIEPVQTKDFSVVQRMLKAYSPAPFHYISPWTGYVKWGTLIQLLQDFPFAKNKYKQTDDTYTCVQIATMMRNWAQSQIFGLCLGIATGDVDVGNQGGDHVWNWTRVDGILVFLDFRGTIPGYAVPHSQYWVMKSNDVKEFRPVDGWYL
jgi:hypothetical protein